MEPVLWLVLGLTTIVAGVVTLFRPGALRLGRVALGLLMLAGGAVINGFYLVTGVDYDDFADMSMLSFVTDTWRSVVAPNQGLFIGLLIVFEAVVGIMVLIGGRWAVAGMVAVMGFHVGLMFFGWAFWVWSLPMLLGVALLLQAQLAEVRAGHRTPTATRRPLPVA